MQDTPSQTQQATEAKSGVVTFPLVARLLALGGAALFALAAWLPWMIVYTAPAGPPGVISSSVRLALTPATIVAPPLNSMFGGSRRRLFIWSALTVLGIPLAALAWMRVSKPITWLIVSGYGLWLLLTLIISIISARDLFATTTFNFTGMNFSPTTRKFLVVSNAPRDAGLGLWLSGLALLICLVGLWALISAARQDDAINGAIDRRGATKCADAGRGNAHLRACPVGDRLPLAGVGLARLPSFVLVSATCQGLSSDGAMTYAISRADSNAFVIDPRVGEYAISILLTIGALFIGVGVWRRGVSTALCGWTTIWLLVAAAFAALAWYGVNLVVNDPTLASGGSGAASRASSSPSARC